MKKVRNIGKVLSKEQQQAVKGGSGCSSSGCSYSYGYGGDTITVYGNCYTLYGYGYYNDCACVPYGRQPGPGYGNC